jgi:hypothetical protein
MTNSVRKSILVIPYNFALEGRYEIILVGKKATISIQYVQNETVSKTTGRYASKGFSILPSDPSGTANISKVLVEFFDLGHNDVFISLFSKNFF